MDFGNFSLLGSPSPRTNSRRQVLPAYHCRAHTTPPKSYFRRAFPVANSGTSSWFRLTVSKGVEEWSQCTTPHYVVIVLPAARGCPDHSSFPRPVSVIDNGSPATGPLARPNQHTPSSDRVAESGTKILTQPRPKLPTFVVVSAQYPDRYRHDISFTRSIDSYSWVPCSGRLVLAVILVSNAKWLRYGGPLVVCLTGSPNLHRARQNTTCHPQRKGAVHPD
jgi:hypothetical protein